MTKERYFEIREKYGIRSFHCPSDKEIEVMDEEDLIKSCEVLKKSFDEIWSDCGEEESDNED